MATEAPSWADQWGAGGIGAIEEDDHAKEEAENKNKKKSDVMGKAKAAAAAGAGKMKNGTTMGIKWIKSKCQMKKTPEKQTADPVNEYDY